MLCGITDVAVNISVSEAKGKHLNDIHDYGEKRMTTP